MSLMKNVNDKTTMDDRSAHSSRTALSVQMPSLTRLPWTRRTKNSSTLRLVQSTPSRPISCGKVSPLVLPSMLMASTSIAALFREAARLPTLVLGLTRSDRQGVVGTPCSLRFGNVHFCEFFWRSLRDEQVTSGGY